MNTVFKTLLIFLLCASTAFAGVNFDLADDVLDCGSALDNLTKISICAWVYPTSEGESGVGTIWIKDEAGTTRKDFRFATANDLFFRVSRATTAMSTSSAVNSLPNGAWAHVCVVWDGTIGDWVNDIKIYINGVYSSSGVGNNGSGALATDGTATEHIGNRDADTQTWDGKITEFYLWEDELTATEVAFLASSRLKRLGLQVKYSTLRQYLPLDEVPEGNSADAYVFPNIKNIGTANCTGDNGTNNTGLTGAAEERISYPSNFGGGS